MRLLYVDIVRLNVSCFSGNKSQADRSDARHAGASDRNARGTSKMLRLMKKARCLGTWKDALYSLKYPILDGL